MKYTMPKISSNDRIIAAFEEIVEALNNSKLQEGFLNGNKENGILIIIIGILFRRKTYRRISVSPSPNTGKIAHNPEGAKTDVGTKIKSHSKQEENHAHSCKGAKINV